MDETSLQFEGLRSADATGLYLLTGANGSGKSSAARAIAAALPGAQLLSAESQQAFYERQLADDESNFRGGADTSSTVHELLGEAARAHALFAAFHLQPLWERGYRLLSTGEARKVLLLRAVLLQPPLLVLDEPFDGLDIEACDDLARAITQVAEHMPIVLAGTFDAARASVSLPVPVTVIREVVLLDHARVTFRGSAQSWLQQAAQHTRAHRAPPVHFGSTVDAPPTAAALVELHQGRVQYGERVIFEQLELVVHAGQHTLIEGPNGSGKSSLLEMLTGDHPQAYVNDLTLFGRRRGTGESVWEIKRNVGLVSGRVHRDYRVGGSVESVLLSGLYDSIGVYQAPTPSERARAHAWLEWLELGLAPGDAFKDISYGQQRLLLVARAAIKLPPLLVLDEPTTGLDPDNSARVFELVESLCSQQLSTVLLVTHRPQERALWEQRIGGAKLSLARSARAGV